MRSSFVRWLVAFLVTIVVAVFQRVTGPTYPVSGTSSIASRGIHYRLERSHGGVTDAPVVLLLPDTGVHGLVEWRRFRSVESWRSAPMARSGDTLKTFLPHQEPAGKLQYRLVMRSGPSAVLLPSEDGVVMRFKGEVPLSVLIIHIVVIFAAMLFSTRAGFEALIAGQPVRVLTWTTVVLLALGGAVLGPIVQKYAFDAYWTGWPLGTDLTDNKTAVALLAWIIAGAAVMKRKQSTAWVVGAALVTLLVFLIPHSLFGSELPPGP